MGRREVRPGGSVGAPRLLEAGVCEGRGGRTGPSGKGGEGQTKCLKPGGELAMSECGGLVSVSPELGRVTSSGRRFCGREAVKEGETGECLVGPAQSRPIPGAA